MSVRIERHDDVELAFVVDGKTIYTRERGDYLIVPLPCDGFPPEAIDAAKRAFRRVVREMEYADDPTDAGMDAALAAASETLTGDKT